MDTSIGENELLTLKHCQWLGLKNENGALVRKGMKGEVQYYDGKFHYCEDNKSLKTLHTCKDLNDIVIPIANAEIVERNRALAEKKHSTNLATSYDTLSAYTNDKTKLTGSIKHIRPAYF